MAAFNGVIDEPLYSKTEHSFIGYLNGQFKRASVPKR
jgi:hypothetical protein